MKERFAMKTRFPLLGLALSAALLAGCNKSPGDSPVSTPSAPSAQSMAPASTEHPSKPEAPHTTDPKTLSPAPGSGEGASASTDPSQKK